MSIQQGFIAKLFTSLLVASVTAIAQQPAEPAPPKYNIELAERLGADTYGMKLYVMAFLRKGPNRNQDSATAAALQAAHLKNIGRMAMEGKLVVAGPFMEDFDIRGIYIFNLRTVEEARALTESDPAIKAGRLTMELHPWYGSAALMEVTRIHQTLEQKSISK